MIQASSCARLVAGLVAVAVLATAASAQNTHVVEVGANFSNTFSPADLILNEGDTVVFEWVSGIHNVRETGLAFDSGAPSGSDTLTVTFDAAFLAANPRPGQVYDYLCDPHVAIGMVGTITVVDTRVLSANATAGATGTFTVTGGDPGNNLVLAYSLVGNGPVQSSWGTASITPPYTQLPPIGFNASGVASMTVNVPAAAQGRTVHMHGVELLGGGSGVLVTPLSFVVQ